MLDIQLMILFTIVVWFYTTKLSAAADVTFDIAEIFR